MLNEFYQQLLDPSYDEKVVYAKILICAYLAENLKDMDQLKDKNIDFFKDIKSEYCDGIYSKGHFEREFERFSEKAGKEDLLLAMKEYFESLETTLE